MQLNITEELIERFGFRSIIGCKSQTWTGFVGSLFRSDELRDEFDCVEFNFDTDFTIDDEKCTQHTDFDDISATAAYTGRSIEHTIFHFPKITTLEKQLIHIKSMISSFFDDDEKNKLSEPILIISNISDTKISAYYIWQSE